MKNGAKVVAIPKYYLGWLSLNPEELVQQLLALNITVKWVYHIDYASPISTFNTSTPLDEALKYAVAIESEETKPNRERKEWKEWAERLNTLLEQTEMQVSLHNPDLVVFVQGYEPQNASIRYVARRRGIPLLALENTSRNDRVVWDNVTGKTTPKNLAKSYYFSLRSSINQEELKEYSFRSAQQSYQRRKSPEHLSPLGVTPEKSKRPEVLFLAQVLTDSSLIFGLEEWGSTNEILLELTRWCNRRSLRLIIKLHPKEARGTAPVTGVRYNKLTYRKIQSDKKLLAELEINDSIIDHDNRFDTEQLMSSALICVTINSQAGLEAACKGKPVVLCGESFYDKLGFTLSATDPKFFNRVLDRAIDFKPGHEAMIFSYIYFEKYCIEKTPTALAHLISRQFEVTTITKEN